MFFYRQCRLNRIQSASGWFEAVWIDLSNRWVTQDEDDVADDQKGGFIPEDESVGEEHGHHDHNKSVENTVTS